MGLQVDAKVVLVAQLLVADEARGIELRVGGRLDGGGGSGLSRSALSESRFGSDLALTNAIPPAAAAAAAAAASRWYCSMWSCSLAWSSGDM